MIEKVELPMKTIRILSRALFGMFRDPDPLPINPPAVLIIVGSGKSMCGWFEREISYKDYLLYAI